MLDPPIKHRIAPSSAYVVLTRPSVSPGVW
jgi:hypothetical protein